MIQPTQVGRYLKHDKGKTYEKRCIVPRQVDTSNMLKSMPSSISFFLFESCIPKKFFQTRQTGDQCHTSRLFNNTPSITSVSLSLSLSLSLSHTHPHTPPFCSSFSPYRDFYNKPIRDHSIPKTRILKTDFIHSILGQFEKLLICVIICTLALGMYLKQKTPKCQVDRQEGKVRIKSLSVVPNYRWSHQF